MNIQNRYSAKQLRLPRASAKSPQSLCSFRGLGCLAFPQASPLFCSISRNILAKARQRAKRSNETSVLLGSLLEPCPKRPERFSIYYFFNSPYIDWKILPSPNHSIYSSVNLRLMTAFSPSTVSCKFVLSSLPCISCRWHSGANSNCVEGKYEKMPAVFLVIL